MKKLDTKARVALLSIVSNTTLIVLKLIAGLLSCSVSIISEAIHSSMDLIASIIAFISVSISGKPADKEHPYGHGKIENISGVIEGLLIFVAAFLIIVEAVKKLMHPTEISQATIAIAVMVFAGIVNIIVSRILYKTAKKEDSIALEADALHLKTDVYTSLGVGVGLLLIKMTGLNFLDPIVAILVAIMIIKEAWNLCSSAFGPLLDASLCDEDEGQIRGIIDKYKDEILDYHEFRTRKSGNMKFIEFHMTVREGLTIKESHDLSDKIEEEIEASLNNTNISIHIEPGNILQ